MKQIYTKTGDEGTTSLRGGVRVPKDDPRIEANGQLDMLNSMLGVLSEELRVKSEEFATAVESSAGTGAVANSSLFTLHSSLPTLHSSLPTLHSSLIKDIQQELMTVMSHVATPDGAVNPRPLHCDELTARMEQAIDAMTGRKPTGFVVPTGFAHVVRAQCRTAERRLWTVHRQHPLDASILRMMNRLSDYLFIVPLAPSILTAPSNLPPMGEASGVTSAMEIASPIWGEDGEGPASPFGGRLEGAVRLEGALHPLMLAGTGSDVGKSVLATALCRIFLQDGYHPAPFKAQNMALNSYATPDGLEIGRAQAVQAEAAGLPCHTDMNPLLLKPQSDHTSQVVLHGKPIGNRDAYDFWSPPRPPLGGEKGATEGFLPPKGGPGGALDFRQEVCAAYDRLAAQYNPIVMEGAGSISEINLRHHDLVNMPMARHAGADVILVADIDRGGVFASVYGSIALQEPEDRERIKGIIINKFRGDLRLFDEGRRMLEDICQVPVLGVIPYMKDIHIEGEDSVALERVKSEKLRVKSEELRVKSEEFATAVDSTAVANSTPYTLHSTLLSVAVVHLPHISNYTDFDALQLDPRIHLYYTDKADELARADIIILPGTKSTLSDLQWLRERGLAEAILHAHREGKTVLGICGGYQMMGVEVLDPDHVEGPLERLPGLGLLPVSTTMNGEKVTRQVSCPYGQGYEIHQGETRPYGEAPERPFTTLDDGRKDGYVASPRCMGTYIHGILDNQSFRDALLAPFADRLTQQAEALDYQQYKQQQYDRLADHVRQHLDMDKLYQILTTDD